MIMIEFVEELFMLVQSVRSIVDYMMSFFALASVESIDSL